MHGLNGRAKMLSVLLIAQAGLFYGLSRGERAASAKPLSELPGEVGAWRVVREIPLENDAKVTLRADDYLNREYGGPSARVNLFVAFFESQRAGQTPHSPKNCLPGSGWMWSVSDVIAVPIAGRASPIEVNRYVVSRGDERAVVLYWYQSRDRVVASEYRAAAFTAWDALRYNRTDTALVRVVVPVHERDDIGPTQSGVEFIQAIFSTLRGLLAR